MNSFYKERNHMIERLNIFSAWVLSVCILALSIVYPLRLFCQKKKLNTNSFIYCSYKFLRKTHKSLGILVILMALFHCRLSSQHLGFNTGTICFFLSILIFGTYFFKKRFKSKWLQLHRHLTILLWLLIIIHIILTRYFNNLG